MITPIIKDIYSRSGGDLVDCDEHFARYDIEIGPDNEIWYDLFYVAACDDNYIERIAGKNNLYVVDGITFANSYTIYMKEISKNKVIDIVVGLIGRNGPYETWIEFGKKMSPYIAWEFNDI